VYRHRCFEASFSLTAPDHGKHVIKATGTQRGRKRHYEAGGFITITGDVGTYCGDAMGIDWMSGNELSQAIPPAYSRYVACQASR
jgi:DNA (cytosine-5)-methyltransferase 1